MKDKNFDIEALLESELRPFKPAPPQPTHTLIMLRSGSLVPKNVFGQPLHKANLSQHEISDNTWDFSIKSFSGQAVIKILQRSGIPFETTVKEMGILALGFPEDSVCFRFPRNIPWKQLPVVTKPHYRIGDEMAQSVCPYLENGEPYVSVSRRFTPVEGSLAELKKVFIQPSHLLKYSIVQKARIFLDSVGAPEVEMHLFWSDRIEIIDENRVREICKRVESMDRMDYNYSLNGNILFQRVLNQIYTQYPVQTKNHDEKDHTPEKIARTLSKTPEILQTLYAIAAKQEKRGLKTDMVVENLNEINSSIKDIKYEIEWKTQWLAKSKEEKNRVIESYDYFIEKRFDKSNGSDNLFRLGRETEEYASIFNENTRLFNKTRYGKEISGNQFKPINSISEVSAENILDRIACLEKLRECLTVQAREVADHYRSIGANISVDENKSFIYDYGVVKHHKSRDVLKDNARLSVWVGSGAYQESNRYQSFGSIYTQEDLKELEDCGLITRVNFLRKSNYNPEILEPFHNFSDSTRIRPYICTARGSALLELLPKECRDPDIMLRAQNLSVEAAIVQTDRRLMKFFRELKRKVADMPASLASKN